MAAVIFDMDGVIVDTERYWKGVIEQVLDELVVDGDDLEPTDLIGINVHDQYELLREEGYELTVDSADEYFDFYDDHAEAVYSDHADLMAGFHDLLDDLDEYGVPLAVCTSSYPNWVELAFDRFDLHGRFDVVVSAADLDIPGKPEPDIYEVTMDRLGVTAAESVVVEDSENGIRAAARAGAHVIAYAADEAGEMDTSDADEVATSANDLRERLFAELDALDRRPSRS
ncbi:HAD family hydrolase [Salarchaeum japonicum]|uniref:HAD family hydrolase n=1 Tax=Salarchaeum japonicum TaxID=555573 RepID=UPI003C746BC0